MTSRFPGLWLLLAGLVMVTSTLLLGGSAGCRGDDAGGGMADAATPSFDNDATPESSVTCTNLECQIVQCIDNPSGTTLLGTVFDPSGTRPVYNATVYVPNAPLDPLATGASCDRCDLARSGAPIRITTTDSAGHFKLDNVPAGLNIPLVVQIGKWRRSVKVRDVEPCTETTAGIALPRNRSEGDIPRIAITTGAADALPCMFRKMGLDDSEFGVKGSDARVHLYRGGGSPESDGGAPRLASASFASGPTFPSAESLWNDLGSLKNYDAVLLACEGADNDDEAHKSPAAKQALYDYARAGGRVLATHYHHTFFSGSPDPAPRGIAFWSDRPGPASGDPRTTSVDVDAIGTSPKATAMKAWLTREDALGASGKLPLFDARHDVDGVDAGAIAWLSADNPEYPAARAVQHLTFGTPIGARDDQLCGRVAFTNLHVGSTKEGALQDDPTAPFPSSCQTKTLSPQQKALELFLLDLLSCSQPDDAEIVTPH